MKKFKCVASRRAEKRSTKKVKKQSVYESRTFIIEAYTFKQALFLAEKFAARLFTFESLKVSEVA